MRWNTNNQVKDLKSKSANASSKKLAFSHVSLKLWEPSKMGEMGPPLAEPRKGTLESGINTHTLTHPYVF